MDFSKQFKTSFKTSVYVNCKILGIIVNEFIVLKYEVHITLQKFRINIENSEVVKR